jgi:hypothetical protein
LAYQWLAEMHSDGALWIGLGSLAVGLAVYRFGFSHIAQKNIRRIEALATPASLFAFISPKSYLLVAGMMTLGMALRSSPIPRGYLAVVYVTIGVALFLSSLPYYPRIWAELRGQTLEPAVVPVEIDAE